MGPFLKDPPGGGGGGGGGSSVRPLWGQTVCMGLTWGPKPEKDKMAFRISVLRGARKKVVCPPFDEKLQISNLLVSRYC